MVLTILVVEIAGLFLARGYLAILTRLGPRL